MCYKITFKHECLSYRKRLSPPGARNSRCIKDLLVTFCCCLLYGQVVVSLTHSPFPFSILLINKYNVVNNFIKSKITKSRKH